MYENSPEELRPFYQKIYDQATALSNRFLIGFFILSLVLAPFYNTWLLSFGLGGVSLLIYFGLTRIIDNNTWPRYLISIIYGNFILLYVLQMKGLYEMYFSYFFALTLLLFFENWKVIVPVTVHAVVSVLTLFEIQSSSDIIPEFLSNSQRFNTVGITLQLGFMIAYAGLCMLWSIMQRKQTTDSAITQLKMDAQLRIMEVNIAFADTISKGNLHEKYPTETRDRLGEALVNMQHNLAESSAREEKEKFTTVGLAQIGEILRSNANDVKQLCDELIKSLVRYLKANQGAIFIIEKEEEEDLLILKSAFAWDRKKFLDDRVRIGEGLIGQAAIEKDTIFLKDVPKNFVRITSGLGEANPNAVVIIPLQSEERVVGVLEMASFRIFAEHEIKFLEKVAESIATTVITTKNNERNQEMLEHSRLMTEQMKAQEEEIRQNMEEMQATQEEMARTQREVHLKARELQEKQDNLNALINNTNDSILAMDTHYRVVVMNDVLKRRYKGTQYESLGVGSDALAALGAVRDEWKGYYDRALAGERMNFTIKSTVQGEDAYREYFINPMLDHDGKIVGLSVFSRDVTDKHKVLNEMGRKGAVLDSIINHDSDTYFAIDKDFRIIVVNNVLKARFQASNIQLNEGDSILTKLPKESLTLWKERYEKALQGEKLKFQEERKLPDRTLFLEVLVEPIYNSNQEVIGCSTVSHDITQQKKMQDDLHRAAEELAYLQQETVQL